MPEIGNLRSIVVAELHTLLEEEGNPRETLVGDDSLVGIGIDSLAFAVLITRLEEALGFDPFMAIEQGGLPRTVNELVELYLAVDRG